MAVPDFPSGSVGKINMIFEKSFELASLSMLYLFF